VRRTARLLAAVAVVLAAAGAGHARGALPQRYLILSYNPTIAAGKPGASTEKIEIRDAGGRLVRLVEAGDTGVAEATFSPDGRSITWIDSQGVNVENADGSHRRVLVAPAARCKTTACDGFSYAWSPDSRRMTVGTAGVETNALLSVGVRTGTATTIARAVRFTEYQVIGYSPDGKQVALEIERGDAGTASCCKSLLAVQHPDGTARRILFSFSDAVHDGAGDATWSPDGTRLAFTDDGRDPRDPRFAIVDVAAGTTHAVGGLQTVDSPPVWSPDGTRLTVGTFTGPSPAYSVETYDLASGRAAKVGKGSVPVAWYRDGTILTAGGAHANTLYAFDSERGRQRVLFSLPKPLQILSIVPAPH
jgi:dipeptidyl aminopeptidase/acylaminoacyl peptidase